MSEEQECPCGLKVSSGASQWPACEEGALLQGFHELEQPEGFRAEFVEGDIVVRPPPVGSHEGVISSIINQVVRSSRTRMDFSGNKGLQLPPGPRCTNSFVIPDGVFTPMHLDLFRGAGSWMEPDGVDMVLEVTSSWPERDRKIKRRCYARSGIPLFLLVDREEDRVWLLREPDTGAEDYRQAEWVSFDTSLDLPEPFGFALQTSEFR